MAETTEKSVRLLLRPTDAEDAWLDEVKTLDPKKAVPILSRMLLDSQEPSLNREMATLILGLLKDESALPTLIQAFKATDPVLRAVAAKALGEIEKPIEDVVAQLIQALKDEDYYVRESAAKALGGLKSLEALPALAHMTSVDEALNNREIAEEVIKEIKGLA